MTDRPRDNDNEPIAERTEDPTPGQGNASGEDPGIARLHKSGKPRQSDEPSLPSRQD